MGKLSNLIKTLTDRQVSPTQLETFAEILLAQETDDERLGLLKQFFIAADLTVEQCKFLSNTGVINGSGKLLLELQRHVRHKAFSESQREFETESTWKFLLRHLLG